MSHKKLILEELIPETNASIDFNIESRRTHYYDNFKRKVETVSLKLKHNLNEFSDLFSINDEITSFFDEQIKSLTKNSKDTDLISICLKNKELNKPIYIAPMVKSKFETNLIFERIQKFAQSFRGFLIDGELDLEVITTENVSGNGLKKAPRTLNENSSDKRSVVVIKNKDNSCGMRALFVAKYFCDNGRDANWRNIRENKFNCQINGAKHLASLIDLKFDEPMDQNHWQKAQKCLPHYHIRIIDARVKSNLIFDGDLKDKTLYLEYYDNHYNAIVNIKAYMNDNFYCKPCHKPYSKLSKHRCKGTCRKCFTNCEDNAENQNISCDECRRKFKNSNCFDNHKSMKICDTTKKCEKCHVKYKIKNNHECFTYHCMKCRSNFTTQPHYCFIKPKNLDELIAQDTVNKIVLAFDIESELSSAQHRPVLLCYKMTCDRCQFSNNQNCEVCHINKNEYFFGYDCCKKFVEFLFIDLAKHAEKFDSQIYVFAHNGRKYDTHFILRELYNMNFKDPNVVKEGNSILNLKLGNVNIIDSLSLFQCALEKLPGLFDLNIQLKKGLFPFLFIKEKNFQYSGSIPDLKYFQPDHMKLNKYYDLLKWHRKLKDSNYIWTFKEELIEYCMNDVNILLDSIQKFRMKFKEITEIDPITRNFTLASIAFEVFQTKFMPKSGIAITPTNSYNITRNSSSIANSWLDWIQKCENTEIIREFRIGKYWADGCNPKTNTFYEFNGCFFHGCDCIHKKNRDNKSISRKQGNYQYKISANEALRKTLKKEAYYRELGFNVVSMWGCYFKTIRKHNEQLSKYIDFRMKYYEMMESIGYIDLREALKGGRTNNYRFYVIAQSDEEIKQLDINSLYPDVQNKNRFPVGHPKQITENFDYSLPYFGFIKCKVEAPNDLYIPVLPVTIDESLLFSLCFVCAKNKSKTCNCEDRTFIGTWTSIELQEAVKSGYKIREIYHVLHYDDVRYDVFSEFIKMWMKIKQEASGWPNWCIDENSRMKYIKTYEEKTGIILDHGKIFKNESLRTIAKLNLNTIWGKMAQRPDLNKVSIIQTYGQYWKLATDDKIEILNETMVTDSTMIVTWTYRDIKNEKVTRYNVAIGSFVTSYARLELLKWMRLVETNRPGSLIYFDTDSIKYLFKIGDPVIPTGEYLGEMCDEVTKDYGLGAKCTKFAALGPKNYAYEITLPNGETITQIKAKGISLTKTALDIITFEKIFNMAIDFPNNEKSPKKLYVKQIHWDVNNHSVIQTRTFEKEYKALCKKRIIVGNSTLPYGFKKIV